MKLTALIDLDAMLHIIAHVQYKAGNRDKADVVQSHVQRFINNVKVQATKGQAIMFYQKAGHQNFRNEILPEYKEHRVPAEAILCWKEVILDAFEKCGAYGLSYIESDDAIGVLAKHIGYDNVVVVTSDKDMVQLPTLMYNPYKPNLEPEKRWISTSKYEAMRFLWRQVITGDPTDMPGALCGVEGIGPKKADKLLDQGKPIGRVVQEIYTQKYGDNAFTRADLTFKMVKLLDGEQSYINDNSKEEISRLIANYHKYLFDVVNPIDTLFDNPAANDSLFNEFNNDKTV